MRGVDGEMTGDDDGKTIGDQIARSPQDQSMILGDLILWVHSMNTFYHGITEAQNVGPGGAREKHQLKLILLQIRKTWLIKYKWFAQGHTRSQRQRTQPRTQRGQSSLPSTASHIIPGMLKVLRFTNPTLSGFLEIRKGKKKSLLHHASNHNNIMLDHKGARKNSYLQSFRIQEWRPPTMLWFEAAYISVLKRTLRIQPACWPYACTGPSPSISTQ